MITRAFAQVFATEWIAAWNSHDLARVLSHYTDDFEMQSPYIAQIIGIASGKLVGKPAVMAYWARALQEFPNLRFELSEVLAGNDSLAIHYRSIRGMATEILQFGAHGLVLRAMAHYE